MKARYLNQFASEMIEYWQQDLTRCGLQDEIINYITMATYLVLVLPNVRGFSGFYWSSIFSDALFARSSKHINLFKVDYLYWFNFSGLKFTKILKTTGKTGREIVAMETQFYYICKCVTFGTMSVSSFNGFCRKSIEIAPFIYSMLNWVE